MADDSGSDSPSTGSVLDAVSKRGKAAGKALEGMTESPGSSMGIASYKKGGKVRKTGPARLHKGERVLNKKQTKKYEKKRGGRK